MNRIRSILVALGAAFMLTLAVSALGQTAVAHKHNLLGESIGLVGYDPLSYFPEGGGKPQKGSIKISMAHDGVTYRFASQEHLELFKADPEKYLPQYGGWCAWASGALNKRVDADPESYVVRNGKLYVFYRDPGLETRALWLKDSDNLIGKADENWPSLQQ